MSAIRDQLFWFKNFKVKVRRKAEKRRGDRISKFKNKSYRN